MSTETIPNPELVFLPQEAFGWEIPDPTFLLSIYGSRLRARGMTLHPWQTQFHLDYAEPFDYKSKLKRMALVANNGSGKSALVLSPCAVWTAMRYAKARVVITSSSGTQLDRQTGRSVQNLCESVNAAHKETIWDIKYRNYTFLPTGSTLEMYATDEAGKAEGYHPHDDSPSNIFSVFCDEAKSITDPMFEPVERQTGKTHWVLVSSPGSPKGFFYRAVCSSRWKHYKVTAYDCPHIRTDEIDGAEEAYGRNSPFFRSAYLAEFTSVDEQVVIPYEILFKHIFESQASLEWIDRDRLRFGVDLSGGGDESVISIWAGNKQIGLECFRFTDPVATRLHVDRILRKYGASKDNGDIAIDHGHIGSAIIAELRVMGWKNIRAVMFGGSAYNDTAYSNRGTELYWNFSRLLSGLILLPDKTQLNQISSRYYKQSDRNQKIILESKREARAAGHSSPDRADGTVLAFATLSYDYFQKYNLKQQAPRIDPIGDVIHGLNIDRLRSKDITAEEIVRASEIYRELREQHVEAIEQAQQNLGRAGQLLVNANERQPLIPWN